MTPESREEIRLLQWVTSEINATLDLERLFETVLRAMDELFGFRHSSILLLDETGESLTVVASRGYPDGSLGARVPLGRGPVGVAARRRKVVRVTNLGTQRAYLSTVRSQMERAGRAGELETEPELPGLADAESQIAIPLQFQETLVGVFFVETAERRVFGEREESLATVVANHAASCIHNARLYEGLKQLTETLEERVRARTEELWRKNRELKETQAQLLQSAKMAALGDLVAGIAHDMNTPLGAIHANADLSERALRILVEGLDPGAVHPRVRMALDSLGKSARTTREASERILSIVRSLRQFARLDEAERKRANLHEGIDTTLELLRHRLEGRVTVVREYGDLPEMVCFPNRLNQVFMNLIANAIDAMREGGALTIRTRRANDRAVIEFIDTGSGIAEEHLGQIFDPGFTTKGVGVGVGLGLPTSYRIVQDHRGGIEVESAPGKGSRFTLTLPIEHT